MADIVRGFVEGVGAGGGAARSVAAGIARVPDVSGVGGDGGPTGAAVDDTADSKPGSAVTVSTSALSRTLRAGVAGPVRGGGACPGTLLIGELDNGEEGEGLWRQIKMVN